MKIVEITKTSLKRASNKEVVNLHHRMHQQWALYERGRRYSREQLISKHQLVVNDMKRRGMKHNYKSSLDNTLIEATLIDALDRVLTEGTPENPDTVIIKNKYYKGLTENNIYEYYIKNKDKILAYIANRSVSFFLIVDNKIIVKRKYKGSPIILNEKNFEELITGRTLCIHLNRTSPTTNYMVIDIDSKGASLHNLLEPWKLAVTLINEEFQKEVVHSETLFSGTGLHYIFYTKKIYNIDKMRERVLGVLRKQDKYLVNKKGTSKINFDMSPNYKGSMHISKFSLAKNGLMVQDVNKYGMAPDKYKIKL